MRIPYDVISLEDEVLLLLHLCGSRGIDVAKLFVIAYLLWPYVDCEYELPPIYSDNMSNAISNLMRRNLAAMYKLKNLYFVRATDAGIARVSELNRKHGYKFVRVSTSLVVRWKDYVDAVRRRVHALLSRDLMSLLRLACWTAYIRERAFKPRFDQIKLIVYNNLSNAISDDITE